MNSHCYWQFGCKCIVCQEDLHEFSTSLGLESVVSSDPAHLTIDDELIINEYETSPAYESHPHSSQPFSSNQEQNHDTGLDRPPASMTITDSSGSSEIWTPSDGSVAAKPTQGSIWSLYREPGASSELPQSPLPVLSDLIEAQCFANMELPDRRVKEHKIPFGEHAIHAESSAFTCSTPYRSIAHPLIVTLPSGNSEIRCLFPQCSGKKFGRLYDYERHYNGAHAKSPTVFWCNVVGCDRCVAVGGRPFPRKDKRNDHMRRVHRA